MKKSITPILAALLSAAAMNLTAADGGPGAQVTDPTEAQEAEEKVQKIIFMQDDDQFNIVSKVYELKHAKAADLAPFVKSAVIRFDGVSTVSRLFDEAQNRQLLIVSTAQDMMPYVDEMIAALDRPGKMGESGSIISGTGIAYGTYKAQYRAAQEMRDLIVGVQISSGPLDSKVRLDEKTNIFYFKDTPARVEEIKQKLSWLDKPVPQARIELKVYEVRDSDLSDLGVDYLAWKNGPGLNFFGAEYLGNSIKGDLASAVANGFGGMYLTPSFDFSFLRLLQQNGRAVINSSAALTVSNVEAKVFSVAFSPEYQNIVKDDADATGVEVGGSAELTLNISDVIITASENGVVNFGYELVGSNVVERNNLGTEASEVTAISSQLTLDFANEKILANYNRTATVEQVIGVPFLCDIPVLKYLFGTTTKNTEKIHYFVTAKAVPAVFAADGMPSGVLAEFDELAKR